MTHSMSASRSTTHAVTADTYHLFGGHPVPVAERPGYSRL
jgi:hypothetical protein